MDQSLPTFDSWGSWGHEFTCNHINCQRSEFLWCSPSPNQHYSKHRIVKQYYQPLKAVAEKSSVSPQKDIRTVGLSAIDAARCEKSWSITLPIFHFHCRIHADQVVSRACTAFASLSRGRCLLSGSIFAAVIDTFSDFIRAYQRHDLAHANRSSECQCYCCWGTSQSKSQLAHVRTSTTV